MRRHFTSLAVLAVAGAAVFWWVTRPAALPAAYDALPGDADRGALIFAAAGCAACHVAPGADIGEAPVLAGGKRFVSDFGTFIAPNISPGSAGVGDWSDAELIHAVRAGVSPDGRHYYPAFPYSSYARSDPRDIADLVAHLRTLPVSETPSQPNEVGFPFNIRRALGIWKILFVDDDWVMAETQTERGRYLVEALGHCSECHTRRNALGGLDRSRWLAGAPAPDGEGRIPNITPGGLNWSEREIAEYLKSGFTPEFDTAGGLMAEVVENTARLTDEDRAAIAAYLTAIPAVAPSQ